MADMVLIVANGNWPRSELIETLLEASDFTIALDGAADRFDSWAVAYTPLTLPPN